MKISAIVSEYNPFHNGHKYLAEQLKGNGSTHIISIMSGSFVQRGECTAADKYSRAKMAVYSGIDLVLELPVIYSCASAERFSFGAVYTLNSCGCINELCFGSECGDISALKNAAVLSDNPEVIRHIISYKAMGYSHPRAVEAALRDTGNETTADILQGANNTLAVEYIKALNKLNSTMLPVTVKRIGAMHDSNELSGNITSASMIRKMICSNDISYKKYVPESTFDIIEQLRAQNLCPAQIKENERSILSTLRSCTLEKIRSCPDVTEGLEHRLHKAIKESVSIKEIIEKVKCKRYTYARISRIIMSIYLCITKDLYFLDPQYIRVLAFNKRGTEILKLMKQTAALPVVMSPSKDMQALSADGQKMLSADIGATDLYGLFTTSIQPCGKDYYTGAVHIREERKDKYDIL